MSENQITLPILPVPELKALDVINGYEVRPGFYTQNGATALSNSCVNFTVQSQGATSFIKRRRNPLPSFLFQSIIESVKSIR